MGSAGSALGTIKSIITGAKPLVGIIGVLFYIFLLVVFAVMIVVSVFELITTNKEAVN